MDILNSGSFVPLENREKVEQLKFTAKELASEAAKTDGFQNNGPSNQQLALEMWKGAEYLCRAHEEATVRNIFLSSFLEKLRDLAKVTRVQPPSQLVQRPPSNLPQTAAAPAAIATPPELSVPTATNQTTPAAGRDEYLGVVPAIAGPSQVSQSSYADQCVSEYDPGIEAIVERLDNEQASPDTYRPSKPIGTGPDESVTAAAEKVASEKSEPDISPPKDQTTVDEVIEERREAEATEPSESPGSESVESIVIAEKEPYNFDACTITAVVQILTESTGFRKCVVSVRSHDFVPQITVSDLTHGSIAEDIGQNLEAAFEQYRTSLPVLAAEKIKKEKPATRKRSAKPTEKSKAANASAESKSSVTAVAAQNSEVSQGQNTLFAS